MLNSNFTITFLPQGISVNVSPGTTLMQAAIDAGVEVDAVCGGKGGCGKCRARLVQGTATEPTETEKDHLTTEQLEQGMALLCQRKALGNIIIDMLTKKEGPGKNLPGKGELMEQPFEVVPLVSKKYHILARPTIEDNVADLDRVLDQLSNEVAIDVDLIRRVPLYLRDFEYKVTSVVFDHELIALEKGDTVSKNYGIAVDIGTTSVAGYLVDLVRGKVVASASATNRQRIHGADVISRITYTVEEAAGLANLKNLMAQTIDEIILNLLAKTGIDANYVYAMTLIGNTVMSHLLLGVSPVGVASAPFVPAFSRSISGKVKTLGLTSLPQYTRFVLLPNIAGYVGSDTVGVILATNIHHLPGNWLAVDIGTNGEIVLSSSGRLLTCSTAAGPAFEGACISQGMRAERGAIYEVFMDDDVYTKVIDDAEPAGICGSGLIDAVAEMIRLGIVKKNGRFLKPEDCPPSVPERIKNRIRTNGNGYKFVLVEGKREIAITQKDISELQLGKGAIRAGIDVLLNELKMEPSQLDGILLAGAFGSNLNLETLKQIGMLPDVNSKRIKTVGNAAGLGAVVALLSKNQLELALKLPKRVKHIELSLHKSFQRSFARAISF